MMISIPSTVERLKVMVVTRPDEQWEEAVPGWYGELPSGFDWLVRDFAKLVDLPVKIITFYDFDAINLKPGVILEKRDANETMNC